MKATIDDANICSKCGVMWDNNDYSKYKECPVCALKEKIKKLFEQMHEFMEEE